MPTVNQFEATYRIPREFSRFRQAIIYVEDASAARPLGDCAGLRRAVSWNKKGSLVMPDTNRRGSPGSTARLVVLPFGRIVGD